MQSSAPSTPTVIGIEIDPIRKDIFGALYDAGLLKEPNNET